MVIFGDRFKEEKEYLARVCRDLNGDFIIDDENKDVSCIIPEHGFAIIYSRESKSYILSFFNDELTLSAVVNERPNIYIGSGSFSLEANRVSFIKAFKTPKKPTHTD